ncbi:MAG: peptide transporter [Bacteroidetes bacterium]|nr:MAG: peptide transporter [Bacteroidota bacterium]
MHHVTAVKSALEIDDLTVAYKYKPVLWDIDMKIPEGVVLGIVGPNGAGKTTLIKTILGLIKPISGSVRIFGEPYGKSRSRVAYVPQKGSVDWDFPTTVFDVVMMGAYGKLGWIVRPGKRERKETESALKKVGMWEFKHRQISQLSGGQQQRVFLARALMEKADLYLMDEPFQGVDATTERAVVELLKELRSEGKTVVVVHHDLQTVSEYFDWVAFLNVKLVDVGPVSETFCDENLSQTYGVSGILESLHRQGSVNKSVKKQP